MQKTGADKRGFSGELAKEKLFPFKEDSFFSVKRSFFSSLTPFQKGILYQIEKEFCKDISDFCLRILIKEKKKNSSVDIDEILSFAYLVLKNCQEKFKDSPENFKYYAYISLKNEFNHQRREPKNIFFEDLSQYDQVKDKNMEFQIADSQEEYQSEAFFYETENKIIEQNIKKKVLGWLLAGFKILTPFEKSSVYVVLFLERRPLKRGTEEKFFQEEVLKNYKTALLKLRHFLEDKYPETEAALR